MMTTRQFALVLAAVAFILPTRADASHRDLGPRVPVTIVLMKELPQPGVNFVIQRRAFAAPQDLILLRNGATEADISDAVRALLVARQAGGDLPTSDGVYRAHPSASAHGNRPALPWVGKVLADLNKANVEHIAGIGDYKAIQIWLPPVRG